MMQRKILLMEDDIDLGETLQELLESKGYGVTLVTNGIEASELSYEKNLTFMFLILMYLNLMAWNF